MKHLKLDIVSQKKISNAMKAKLTAQERADIVSLMSDRHATLTDPQARYAGINFEYTPSRPNTERYQLFYRGVDPAIVIGAILPEADQVSPLCREIDYPLLKRVGGQGAHFSSDYLLPFYAAYYNQVQLIKVDYDNPVVAYALDAIDFSLTDALEGKLISPLTYSQAIDHVTRLDTVSHPTGGYKSDPSVKEWLYSLDWDGPMNSNSSKAAQRYQRNKHDADGNPIPRAVFNDDVREVVKASRFEHSLVLALQGSRVFHPWKQLLGPHHVGEELATWDSVKPTLNFTSIEVDVKNMDVHYSQGLAMKVAERLAKHFDDPAGLVDSVRHSFMSDLIIDKDTMLEGEHAFFSGVCWAHEMEDMLSAGIGRCLGDRLLAIVVPSKAGPKFYNIDNWKPYRLFVSGDDFALVFSHPAGVKFAGYNWNTGKMDIFEDDDALKRYLTATWALFGLPTHPEKIAVGKDRVNFCSMTYSRRAVVRGVDGLVKAFRPVYSPVSALNNILFPEEPLAVPCIETEIARVAQIVDQCYGHELFDRMTQHILSSISSLDMELIRKAWVDCDDIFDIAAAKILRSNSPWSVAYAPWASHSSPFLHALRVKLELSSDQAQTDRGIKRDANLMKALHWRYHILPDNVLSPCEAEWTDSARNYWAFFTELLESNGAISPDLQRLQYALTHDACGAPSQVRDPSQYDYSQTFGTNMKSDTPLKDRVGDKPLVATQSFGTVSSDNPIKGKFGF